MKNVKSKKVKDELTKSKKNNAPLRNRIILLLMDLIIETICSTKKINVDDDCINSFEIIDDKKIELCFKKDTLSSNIFTAIKNLIRDLCSSFGYGMNQINEV